MRNHATTSLSLSLKLLLLQQCLNARSCKAAVTRVVTAHASIVQCTVGVAIHLCAVTAGIAADVLLAPTELFEGGLHTASTTVQAHLASRVINIQL